MQVPEWFCSVVCAGLEIYEILPNKPIRNKLTIENNKKNKNDGFRFREINLDIKDFEENDAVNPIDNDEFDEEFFPYTKGPNLCSNIVTDGLMCMKYGVEISQWFSERALNPGNLCNYSLNNCNSLFKK